MARNQNSKEKEQRFYSRLIINQTKKMLFYGIFSLVFTGVCLTIAKNIWDRGHWNSILLPILIIGIPLIFFPLIETWEYRPWQTKAQKYETHYRD